MEERLQVRGAFAVRDEGRRTRQVLKGKVLEHGTTLEGHKDANGINYTRLIHRAWETTEE